MGKSVPVMAEESVPRRGEQRRHRGKGRRLLKWLRRRVSKLRRGVVGLFFALQIAIAIAGLVILPIYLLITLVGE